MPADVPDRNTLDPDTVASQSFTKVRKGFEPDEVRAYLMSLASQLREAKNRQGDLERRLAEVERRAADPRDLDEHAVTQMLGEETARVLEAARTAAIDIRSRAEAAAAASSAAIEERDRSTRAAADEYAEGVRSAVDEAAIHIRADAEAYAAGVRESADADTTAQRAAADEYDQRIRVAADAEVADLRSVASAEVERMRAEAGSVLADRTAEAETAASVILAEADGYSTRVRSDADRYAEATRSAADSYRTEVQSGADAYRADAVAEGDRLRSEVAAEVERLRIDTEDEAARRLVIADADAQAVLDTAREAGREMVQEARSYRERIIADLADRRRAARGQLEQLAATRDALAVSLSDVASSVTASHRALADTVIDPRIVGDVGSDRKVLEAGDRDDAPLGLGDQRHEERPSGSAAESDLVAAGDEVDEPDEVEPVAATAPSVDRPEPLPVDEDQAEAEAEAEAGGAEAAVEEEAAAEVESDLVAAEDEVDEPGSEGEPEIGAEADAGEPTGEATPEPVEADQEEADRAEAVAEAAAGPDDGREGRIDAIFARIRADREEPIGLEEPPAAVAEDEVDEPDEVEPAAADADTDAEQATTETPDVDPDTDLLDRRDATTDEIERQLARKLKRVLSDEQNETLDLLRRVKGTPLAADVLPNDIDHHERYRAATLDDLAAAERAGASFFGEAPQRRADVFDVAGEFATEIQRQIRKRLERAFEEGGDEQELGERIRACYREWKTQRIAETARHFVIVAFSRGVTEAADDATAFRWLVDDGGQPCPDCDDNSLAGGVSKGEPFPTGHPHPPAHPGCRCLAVPVYP